MICSTPLHTGDIRYNWRERGEDRGRGKGGGRGGEREGRGERKEGGEKDIHV